MDRLSDYTYDLPERLIAQTPLSDRSASRLLHLDRNAGTVQHYQFRDCVHLLHRGDLLVMNDTRVTALRLFGRKQTGGAVELLLLRRLSPFVYQALTKPAKTLRLGTTIDFEESGLSARVVGVQEEGLRTIEFEPRTDFDTRLQNYGLVPLPPYIHERLSDPERYQTVYAESGGSAAAPTAGLHFTNDLLESLTDIGVSIAHVTLHVSIDTFKPISVDNLDDHKMHGETCILPESTALAVNNCQGRVIAVGTTTVRTLESFATGKRQVHPGEMVSRLFIRPGYDYKVVDGMFTNFHLPGTTMMLMISALGGRDHVLSAYAQAVQQEYRFLSFGDSMLIL